jgi:hypothetical protein
VPVSECKAIRTVVASPAWPNHTTPHTNFKKEWSRKHFGIPSLSALPAHTVVEASLWHSAILVVLTLHFSRGPSNL